MFKTNWNVVLPISTIVVNATAGNKIGYNDLIEITMTIVRSCTTFNSDKALLLAGEYEEFLHRSLVADLPVALITESKWNAFDFYTLSKYSFALFNQFSFLHLLCKLNQFAVIASSQPLLRLLLQRIKDSTWANFNGYHVLIDRRTEERGCANAYKFLWTAWQYDLLAATFLCIDPDEGLVLFTYNPYSDQSPSVWREAGRFKGRAGHPWVLLKRKYRDGTCEGLIFDKTRNLNGYEVRLNAISFQPHLRIDSDKPGFEKFSGDNNEIIRMLFHKLNATLNVLVYNGTVYDLGGVDSRGNMVGMLADVSTGTVDMGMNVRSLHTTWKIEHTYPHGEDGLCVITQRSGEISEFAKILSFMSPGVYIGNFVVFLTALLLLSKYEGFLPACLNVIRLITSVSMRRLPQATFFRIFFHNLFLLILILNTLVQSHWSSLLTVPVSRPNIRTSEDLKRSNHEIYGSIFYVQEIYDPVLRSRYHEVGYHECKDQVLRSPYAACLGDCLHLFLKFESNDVHLHRSRRIRRNVQVYATRENWPLFNRASDVIRGAVEGGLVNMWRRLNNRKMYLARKRRRVNDQRSFRILKIRHISFSFYLLAIGYCLAAVAFLAELAIGCRPGKTQNVKPVRGHHLRFTK